MTDHTEERIKLAVNGIVNDLSDRRGLRQAWEQIDADIQQEIRDTWAGIIRAALKAMEKGD